MNCKDIKKMFVEKKNLNLLEFSFNRYGLK